MRVLRLVFMTSLLLWAHTAASQGLNQAFQLAQEENAQGSLAILGLAGIPDDAASVIFLESNKSNRDFDYKSAQIGGGFRLSADLPLYLEGYIGYARYDPNLLLEDGTDTASLPLKWTSVAATGGIGWQFDLGHDFYIRPLAHLSIGRTQSDASVGTQAVANKLGLNVDYLRSGGLWAGGYGASVTFGFDRTFRNDHQLEARLRSTYIEYHAFDDEDQDILASATAANAVLWSRYRFPTQLMAFSRPIRGVVDFSYSYLLGDQSDVLGTDWLAKVGGGFELDISETNIPWVTAARFMLRYYGSDTVNGFTAGLGISF